MAWGGARPGAGRKPAPVGKKANPRKTPARAEPKLKSTAVTVPAEAISQVDMPAIDPKAWAMMLPEIEEISRKYSTKQPRSSTNNPFKLPEYPKPLMEAMRSKEMPTMAMDNALTSNLDFAGQQWLSGGTFAALPGEGLEFLGFTYLAELAQRPEFRVMSETIADDATRKWIDFDVVGDEKKQKEDRAKDPQGYDERMADPDARKKRVDQSGKTDKVKALKDDQLRLEVRDRFYEQWRNDGFFGRSHLFLDIRAPGTDEINPEELKSSIGDSRDKTSETKCQKGFFQGMRTIEPVWTYPLMYNAINPLRKDWYNPQTWFVMGQEIDGTRCQTFIGHPVPDMLKPAYAFSGLSLTQMAKPYVDIWLQTRQSVAQLIHSFSVMVLMTDLGTLMQPGNLGNLLARVAMFNMFRDNQGAFVVNKNTEDFKNVSASLSGLHELQAQSQEHMASVHRIPLVKFTGIQPSGLNASSEGEIEVYDDTIMASQTRFGDPNLRRIINFQQLSLFGQIDREISHRWEQLRPISQAEKGQKEKDDAERNQKYVDMGAISPGEVRKVIVNDKELPYTEFNPEDVPDLQQEEEEGLEPQGGRPDPKAGGEGGTGPEGPERDGGGAADADTPFGADNRWATDPVTGEPVVLAGDAFNEADHPRGQPNNAGQFGPGGGGSTRSSKSPKLPSGFTIVPGKYEGQFNLMHGGQLKAASSNKVELGELAAGIAERAGLEQSSGRKYGGLYKQTGAGAKADHRATVKYAIEAGPRAGSSYREMVARLIKDTPEHGEEGDAEKLKAILAQSYLAAADQLRAKAALAAGAEAVKLDGMAKKALAKAEALGLQLTILPPDKAWIEEHDAPPALQAFRESTRKDLVERGVKESLEDMSLFDLKSGKVLDMKAGARGARNVKFSPEMVAAFSDPGVSLELHHNHPSDTSFSAQDLDSLGHYPGMSRVYAHGHAGSTYAVAGASKLKNGFRPVMDYATSPHIYGAIGRLPLSPADKSRILQHVVVSGLERAGLIQGYSAHMAPDLAAHVAGLKQFDGWVAESADRAKRKAKEQS